MKRIPLRNRQKEVVAYALVDDEDFEWLSQWRWCLSPRAGQSPYVRRNVVRDGTYTTEYMHQAVARRMGIEGLVDHRDRNRLNNQRANLRSSDHSRNAVNSRRVEAASGVCWDKRDGKWKVQVMVGGRRCGRSHVLREDAIAEAAQLRRRQREAA